MSRTSSTDGGASSATLAIVGKGEPAVCPAVMPNDGVERLAIAFERSAKRWEMVAYPAMVVFTLLGLYGFYQIYSVTREMRLMAEQLQPQMGDHMNRLTDSMQTLTANIAQMSRNIHAMQGRVAEMSNDTRAIAQKMDHLETMDRQMASINQSVQAMTMHTDMMRWNMATMNKSIQRPLNFMNGFMPW